MFRRREKRIKKKYKENESENSCWLRQFHSRFLALFGFGFIFVVAVQTIYIFMVTDIGGYRVMESFYDEGIFNAHKPWRFWPQIVARRKTNQKIKARERERESVVFQGTLGIHEFIRWSQLLLPLSFMAKLFKKSRLKSQEIAKKLFTQQTIVMEIENNISSLLFYK